MTTQQARCVHDQPRTTDRYLRMGRKPHDTGRCSVRDWLVTLAACEVGRNGRSSALGSRPSGEFSVQSDSGVGASPEWRTRQQLLSRLDTL